MAEFCEEFLLFDKVSLKADRINYSLHFLILEFGIDTIQEYFERGLIELLLWTPFIGTKTGNKFNKGDQDSVIGTPPLISGNLAEKHRDPENNIAEILKNFQLSKDRIKSFKKAASKATIIPNDNLAAQSVAMTIDAYETGKLNSLGLKNTMSAENLDIHQRLKLLRLSSDVLETAILAQYEYKSFNQYSYSEISKQALESIGGALKIKEASKIILNIENIPDLKSLFISGKLKPEELTKLRYKSSAKAFRRWLDEVSKNQDCTDVSKEYINELTGKNSFWSTHKGKIVKNISMLGVGSALGVAIDGLGITSATLGAAVSKIAELGLGLFDSFYLDGLLKGQNPRMFLEEIENTVEQTTE